MNSDQIDRTKPWTKPAAPEPSRCACGATVGAEYIEPIFGAAQITRGWPLMGTGVWQMRERCSDCEIRAGREEQARIAAARAAAHGQRVAAAIARAGFRPIELDMEMSNLRAPAPIRAALDAWARGEKALYLHGKATGTGKTHSAVAALKTFMHRTGDEGLFRPVVVLMKDLRQAIGRFRDGQLLDTLTSAKALVLDDIGVERPTETVLEGLYTVIDHHYAHKNPYVIVTSNLPLDELSKQLDDRIASRLAGMCRVIEFAGRDARLPGFEGTR